MRAIYNEIDTRTQTRRKVGILCVSENMTGPELIQDSLVHSAHYVML